MLKVLSLGISPVKQLGVSLPWWVCLKHETWVKVIVKSFLRSDGAKWPKSVVSLEVPN